MNNFNCLFSTPIHLTCACLSHQATAEANNLAAVATAKDQYYKNMEKVRSLTYVKNKKSYQEMPHSYNSDVKLSLVCRLRCVEGICPTCLLNLWRKSITFTSERLFTLSPRQRRWADKSFVIVTKHSWRRRWRTCGSRSSNTMRSETGCNLLTLK